MIRLTTLPKFVLTPLVVAIAISGCDGSGNADANAAKARQYVERAENYRQHGQYGAAIIEARNAMKLAPENKAGAVELANLLNELGQPRQAIELLKPLAETGDKGAVLALAQAYLLQHKFQSTLDYIQSATRRLNLENDNELRLKSARAYIGLGQYEEASALLQALRDTPQVGTQAQLHLAEIDYLQGDIEASETAIKQLLEKAPNDVNALIMAANLAEQQGRLDQAEDLLSRALMNLPQTDTLTPVKANVLQKLTTILTKRGRTGEALIYAKTLSDANPEGAALQDKFKQGVQLFEDGNLDEAEKILSEVYDQSNNDLAGTLLGMIRYSKNDMTGAANYLDRHVDPEVASDAALMALASTQLRMEQPNKLLELIGPEERSQIKNPQLKALLGIAMIQTGDSAAGEKLVTSAQAEQPANGSIRAALARYYLSSGQAQKALALLEQGLSATPKDEGLNRLYIGANMALGKSDRALATAQSFAETAPATAENYLLYGHVALLAKKYDVSQAALQKALTLKPDYPQANLELAQLHMARQQPQPAQDLYKRLIGADPDNVAAIKGFVTTQEMIAGRQSVADNIEPLIMSVSQSQTARAVIAEYYLRNRQFDATGRILKGVDTGAEGSYVAAVKQTYTLALAEQALAAKNYPDARLHIVDSLRVNPRNPQLLGTLAHIEIQAGELKEAEKVIAQLDQIQPQAPIVLKLRGDLAQASNQGGAAAEDFRKLWDMSRTDSNAARLYKSLEAQDGAAAEAFLREWQTAMPQSDRPYLIRAVTLQKHGNAKDALAQYEAALTRNGNNPVTLNNLAWLYFEKGDKRALALAEKATQLDPKNPAILDTYGWLLVQNKEAARGIAKLEEAAKLAPDSKEIAEHLRQAKGG